MAERRARRARSDVSSRVLSHSLGGVLVCVTALALVGVTGEPALAKESVDLTSPTAETWLGDRYYGVFRGQSRVGWLRRSLSPGTFEELPAIVRSVESFIDVAGDGNGVRSLERAVYLADGGQLLVQISRSSTRQGVEASRTATRRGERFDVVTTRDGKEATGAVNAVEVTLHDELILEGLVAAAATRAAGPAGAQATSAGLDLGSMRRTERTLEVTGTEEIEGGGLVYLVAVKMPDGRLSPPMLVGADGAIVRGVMGGGLKLRRMPKEDATAEVGLTSIEVSQRLPMDAGIGDPSTLTELVVSMPMPAAGLPTPFPSTGRQMTEAVDGRLVLRVRPAIDAGAVSDEERSAAMGKSPGIDPSDPKIVAAANRALAGTSRTAVQVSRLLGFTAAYVGDAVVLDEPSATAVLESRRGDCSEHARLFVALARASGIPAREVGGVVWLGDDQKSFGWHAWAEVELLGRWRPVDPTTGVMPPHAAHLRVDSAARAAGALDDVRLRLEQAER